MMKVSVLMPAYNHEQFVGQAIDSFLMQVCDFEVELLIGNNCSTDSTGEIAARYAAQHPSKIKLFTWEQNLGLVLNYKELIDRATGTYLAVLESDDYWTDANKLQMQVDFLDANPDYGLCNTYAMAIDDNGDDMVGYIADHFIAPDENLYRNEILGNKIIASSACFRRDLTNAYCDVADYAARGFKCVDYPMWLALAAKSKFHYINQKMMVYRVLSTSISNDKSYQKQLDYVTDTGRIIRYSIEKFGDDGLSESQINNRIVYLQLTAALKHNQKKDLAKFAKQIKPIDLQTFIIRYFPSIWVLKNRKQVYR